MAIFNLKQTGSVPRIQRGFAAAHVLDGRLRLRLGFRCQDVALGVQDGLHVLEVHVCLASLNWTVQCCPIPCIPDLYP